METGSLTTHFSERRLSGRAGVFIRGEDLDTGRNGGKAPGVQWGEGGRLQAKEGGLGRKPPRRHLGLGLPASRAVPTGSLSPEPPGLSHWLRHFQQVSTGREDGGPPKKAGKGRGSLCQRLCFVRPTQGGAGFGLKSLILPAASHRLASLGVLCWSAVPERFQIVNKSRFKCKHTLKAFLIFPATYTRSTTYP